MDHQSESQTALPSSEFSPPRHWIGMEELQASYWEDAKVQERRGQEFHDKPIETLALIERMDQKGIARREFLTIMGASMAMASFACARRPVHKIIPYVNRPEELMPGLANWYASTDPETDLGVLVKTREGRPVKLEGNPDHPLNTGTLSARAQAAVLSLYDPDRLRDPLARERTTGFARKTAWADVDSAVSTRLKSAKRVRILSRPISGESERKLVQEFLMSFQNGALVEYAPFDHAEILEGQDDSYGTSLVPSYRFTEADVIVSFGADFLGSWVSPVEHARDFGARRKLDRVKGPASKMSKLIVFEPSMSLTGSNADERFAIRPGDELKIALAIAHELVLVQKKTRYASDSAIVSILQPYNPRSVAEEIGLRGGAGTISKVATALWESRGRGLVVSGGAQSQTRDVLALQVATNFLNSALENEGKTVDGTANPDPRPRGGSVALLRLINEMKSGAVDVLIIHGANPAYTLPQSAGFQEAVRKVPLVVASVDRDQETAKFADYVLPEHHWLEDWGDSHPRRLVVGLQQPVISPLFNSRSFGDSLLSWIRGAELKSEGLARTIAYAKDGQTWHDYLKANWRDTLYKQKGNGATFETFWEDSLRTGALELQSREQPRPREFRTSSLSKLPKYSRASGELALALYTNVAIGDGQHANNAWLQELPDPISSVTWDNYAAISPALWKKLALTENDVVELTTSEGKVEIPARLQPGLHEGVVAVALGYGRRAAGDVAKGAGVDLYPLTTVDAGQQVFSGHSVKVRRTGKVYKLADTQWHFATENRPIINDVTLAEFEKNPHAGNETNPELRLEEVPTIWPKHEYKGYRWGMAIDLTSCIGCGACVIGCQAENNIPVVGRENVRVSRQMHWIRIDRYYAGAPENPDVVYQPMLCQHCENAPCETVCPVLATVHDDEGTSNQVYNRCVGTRYCQNNCPYKVRRFNFFDHWKDYKAPLNLAWNPEVTVRSRGIMEKCSFCIQRIQSGKLDALRENRKVRDLEIKTACQQTCPTNAIVFGNVNDPQSEVSKLREGARAFRVLETLNTKPSISYLTKVRNKEGEVGHEHG